MSNEQLNRLKGGSLTHQSVYGSRINTNEGSSSLLQAWWIWWNIQIACSHAKPSNFDFRSLNGLAWLLCTEVTPPQVQRKPRLSSENGMLETSNWNQPAYAFGIKHDIPDLLNDSSGVSIDTWSCSHVQTVWKMSVFKSFDSTLTPYMLIGLQMFLNDYRYYSIWFVVAQKNAVFRPW